METLKNILRAMVFAMCVGIVGVTVYFGAIISAVTILCMGIYSMVLLVSSYKKYEKEEAEKLKNQP